jgi:hypothetical protein
MPQGDKFAVHGHGLDNTTVGGVDGLRVLGRKHQLRKFVIDNVLGGSEVDVITDCSKEGNCIDKE